MEDKDRAILNKLVDIMMSIQSEMATKDDIKKVKQSIDHLRNVLDTHAGMLDTDELERLALQKQVDRHEAWIDAAARKLSMSSQA